MLDPKKFGQNWVSNSWDIPNMDKCCLDKCQPELESMLDGPRNLRLKFHQSRVSNSWDIADLKVPFGWWWVVVVAVVVYKPILMFSLGPKLNNYD